MRTLAGVIVFASCVLLTASAALAATGIAFDQIIMSTNARPLPKPTDFDRVWNDELAVLQTHACENPTQRVREYGQALSIAVLGDWVRTEIPSGGAIVVKRPDLHEVIYLYPDKKYYVHKLSAKSQADLYRLTTGRTLAPVARNAPTIPATQRVYKDAFPDSKIGDFTVTGFAERLFQSVDATPSCTFAQQAAFVVVYVIPRVQETILSGDAYGAPLNFAARSLSALSGCNVTPPPDFMTAFPTYPAFLLFKATYIATSHQDLSFVSLPSPLPAILMMRGHLHGLSDADKALFEIPAGYTEIKTAE